MWVGGMYLSLSSQPPFWFLTQSFWFLLGCWAVVLVPHSHLAAHFSIPPTSKSLCTPSPQVLQLLHHWFINFSHYYIGSFVSYAQKFYEFFTSHPFHNIWDIGVWPDHEITHKKEKNVCNNLVQLGTPFFFPYLSETIINPDPRALVQEHNTPLSSFVLFCFFVHVGESGAHFTMRNT